MFGLKKFNQLAILLVFVLVLSGCDLKDAGGKLRKLDDRIGQGLDELQKKQQEDVINLFEKEEKKELSKAKDLTSDQIKKIEDWIGENNLNRYGDPADMMYVGGTPLFNEATGESVDRYDYILKNHQIEKIWPKFLECFK